MTRDHSFHELRVSEVIEETADARSFVLDVPPELADAYTYEPGQFLTFRVCVDATPLLRCYSMSSSPATGDPLTVTVKRVPGGAVSNWMIDNIRPGDVVETTVPAGVFCLPTGDGDVVAFGAGSGITPIFSILKTVLATTERRVRLLYANRDRDSIIFGGALDALAAKHGDQLEVVHRLDVEHGFADADTVAPFIDPDAEAFICGPGPFMDIVEGSLLEGGVAVDRIHIERFTAPPEVEPERDAPADAQVTITLNGKTATTQHRLGTTLLQTARSAGMSPPFSCESGSCATCMAMLVEGTVEMRTNNALTPDEVEEGWVLTCQAVPTSPSVRVVYE